MYDSATCSTSKKPNAFYGWSSAFEGCRFLDGRFLIQALDFADPWVKLLNTNQLNSVIKGSTNAHPSFIISSFHIEHSPPLTHQHYPHAIPKHPNSLIIHTHNPQK
mmetsp:Transcript_24565/g.61356  ORF Transcript_24565/g.61356 Transcript_24565/m.61356 type:complete len:106 (-) Transcript_24565:58-375(-)